MKLTDFKALTFDCYGTLIDWETGMVEALKSLTSKASRSLSRITWRTLSQVPSSSSISEC